MRTFEATDMSLSLRMALVIGLIGTLTVYADVNDLRITEVDPATGQVEVTHTGSAAFTTSTLLPFCHR
jgi:hypothetical protein